ncbi:Cryptochrome DASH chloroplastic/mitochondrial [Bienertia sinuspersici]
MYTLRHSSLSFFSLQKLSNPLKPTSFALNFTQICISKQLYSMSSTSKSELVQSNQPKKSVIYKVPAIETNDIDKVAGQTFQRYYLSSSETKRNGKGVCILWFRNDLRVLDNEALFKAWASSEVVLPVYCVDPRIFGTTYNFGFPKTGALRAQFLIESLADLKRNLQKHGLNLLIKHGKPEEILPALAETFGAHTIYAQKETCSEELNAEARVNRSLQKVCLPSTVGQSKARNGVMNPKLQLVWGCTLYHKNDLPFDMSNIPDVYTQFRKSVESRCTLRACIKIPATLGPPPEIEDWGALPSIDQFRLHNQEVDRGLAFVGGESAALSRVYEYFWKKDLLKTYKVTRNGMLGSDYSTKFSPWLASGSLSPRFVKRYEKERQANDSTYWVLFELIWRDYFRFLSIKYGNSIFHLGGPRQLDYKWSQDSTLFEAWRDGKTGYPLIDANMKELATTGFMSNRGRQIVCSFLVRDMGIDWRMGQSGLRHVSWITTLVLTMETGHMEQAQVYDPEGEYVAYWLQEVKRLPKDKRHFPGFSYLKPIVPLKYGNTSKQGGQKAGTSKRDHRSGGPQNKQYTK